MGKGKLKRLKETRREDFEDANCDVCGMSADKIACSDAGEVVLACDDCLEEAFG